MERSAGKWPCSAVAQISTALDDCRWRGRSVWWCWQAAEAEAQEAATQTATRSTEKEATATSTYETVKGARPQEKTYEKGGETSQEAGTKGSEAGQENRAQSRKTGGKIHQAGSEADPEAQILAPVVEPKASFDHNFLVGLTL